MENKQMQEKILNKQFKKGIFSGYDTVDVDSFFDEVIEYLKENDSIILSYKNDIIKQNDKIKALENNIASLQRLNKQLEAKISEYKQEGYGHMNIKNKK